MYFRKQQQDGSTTLPSCFLFHCTVKKRTKRTTSSTVPLKIPYTLHPYPVRGISAADPVRDRAPAQTVRESQNQRLSCQTVRNRRDVRFQTIPFRDMLFQTDGNPSARFRSFGSMGRGCRTFPHPSGKFFPFPFDFTPQVP